MAWHLAFGSNWRRIALLAAMTALAACGTPGTMTGESSNPEAAVSKDTASVDPMAPAAATAATPDPDAAIEPDPPKPDELIGMVAEQVAGRIGRPDHVWRESPAAVWQYADRGCVLHVFLYPDAGDMRVRHVELRGGAAASGSGDCYAGLIVERMTPAGRG